MTNDDDVEGVVAVAVMDERIQQAKAAVAAVRQAEYDRLVERILSGQPFRLFEDGRWYVARASVSPVEDE